MNSSAVLSRKRVNLMIDATLLIEMEGVVPSGQRSDFVNGAIEQALNLYSRRKAIELMEASQKKSKKPFTTEEILNLIRDGRKF